MKFFPRVLVSVLALAIAHPGFAQVDEQTDEAEQLKLAALEALMQAPSDRALPISEITSAVCAQPDGVLGSPGITCPDSEYQ